MHIFVHICPIVDGTLEPYSEDICLEIHIYSFIGVHFMFPVYNGDRCIISARYFCGNRAKTAPSCVPGDTDIFWTDAGARCAFFKETGVTGLNKYQHIIWDWNGTLINDVQLCLEILNQLLHEQGLEAVALGDYRQHFQFPVIRYYEFLGFDVDQGGFEKASRYFLQAYENRRTECELYSGVRPALHCLDEAGIGQSILSAYHHTKLLPMIDHYGIGQHFQHILGVESTHASGKLKQGRTLVNQLQLPPDALLLIGDTLHDYEVARDIGCDCLLVSHGHNAHEKLAQCSAPVIQRFSEIIPWLQSV